jgi:hypothetical protein
MTGDNPIAIQRWKRANLDLLKNGAMRHLRAAATGRFGKVELL